MASIDRIPLGLFGIDQAQIVYKILVLQHLCPGAFQIQNPHPQSELDEMSISKAKDALRALMPLDTLVTDMWDWDIHFEDLTFSDTFFDIALGNEEYAMGEALALRDDILSWISEYGMDYAQDQLDKECLSLADFVMSECVSFVQRWRRNIVESIVAQ